MGEIYPKFSHESQFILSVTDKLVDFIKRNRWKTFFYNPGMVDNEQTFVRKSLNIPYSNKMLEQFEEDLFKIV